MREYPRAASVILTYDEIDMTRACVRSVMRAAYAKDKHTTYLVDNGSRRVSAQSIAAEFSGLRFLNTGRNLGFAAGNNLGIRQALLDGAKYIFILNNDTEVREDYLISTVDAMESDRSIGICGSMMLDFTERGRIQEAGFRFDAGREYPVAIASGERDDGRWDSVVQVDSVTGAAMCLRGDVLPHIGLFDPSFFAYWEDTDLCFRFRAVGHGVVCNGQSKVYHLGNLTLGAASRVWLYCATRNYLWFAKRHGFGLEALRLKLRRMPWTMGWLFLKAKRGRIVGAYIRGLLDGWRQPPLPKERLLAESMNPAYVPWCPYV